MLQKSMFGRAGWRLPPGLSRRIRDLGFGVIRRGKPGLAMELLRLPLNRIGVRALYAEARAEGLA